MTHSYHETIKKQRTQITINTLETKISMIRANLFICHLTQQIDLEKRKGINHQNPIKVLIILRNKLSIKLLENEK